MKLTTTSALTLAQALPLLDKSADGKPFALPGKVRWNIVKNLAILTRFSEDYEKTRQAIIVALTPEGGTAGDIDKEPALIASFRKQIKEILETEQEIPGLLTLALADLNLAILTRFSEDYEKTRQAIIVALTPEGGTAADIDKDPALIASFRAQIKEILETDQEIPGLLTLALADLNLDANAIPVPVLLALQPLISE